jgi:serine/threonine protein kinase
MADECEAVTIPDLPSSLNLIVRHDDIELFEEIGVGQSGSVVRGVVKSTGDTVAVKILQSRVLSPIEVEMFRREVAAMAVLKHPSLVRFCGYTTEYPFYVLTEYMRNGSLSDYLERNPGGLSPTERTLIAQDVARGMEYLHGRGIIHRDLKSSNILLDQRRRGRICDFGLIRMKSSDPMTGMIGTSHWMAPEVLLSSPFYDEKVDVFSFGVVLWELLTSRRPYQGEDILTLIVDVTERQKRPEIPDSCPEGLRTLIERCWQADAKLRPSFHEIVAKLSDADCQFPGCELLVIMQETGLRGHHGYSSSSPARCMRNALPHRLIPSTESFCRAIRRSTDAMALGHMEHFSASVMQLRQAGRSPNIDFQKVMPELMNLVKNAQAKFRPRVVQVLFEVLGQTKAIDYFNKRLIGQWLRSDNDGVVQVVQVNLAMNPDPAFFERETIEALLTFAAHPQGEARARAFAPLLSAMGCRPDIFIANPEFLASALNFTVRKLSPGMLQQLLANLRRIFRELTSAPDGIVVRLIRMQTTSPESIRKSLSRCIELLLRFDSVKLYYSQIWQNAIQDFDNCKCLFLHFVTRLPVNVLEFVAILMRAAANHDGAISILTQVLQGHDDTRRVCCMFLPTRSRNAELLARFYEQLLTQPEVLRHKEFYEVADRLCESAALCDLLASPDVDLELLGQSGLYPRIVDLLHDLERQAAMLGLIIAIAAMVDVPIFRKNAAKISGLLANERLRERAFLALAAIAKFGPEGIDTEALLAPAVEFKNGPPGPARQAALNLFPEEASEEEEKADGYDDEEEEDDEKTADEEEEKTVEGSDDEDKTADASDYDEEKAAGGDEEEKTADDEEEKTADDEAEKTADDEAEKTADDEEEKTAHDEEEKTAHDEEEKTAGGDEDKTVGKEEKAPDEEEESEMATTEPGDESSEESTDSESSSRPPEDEESQEGDEDLATLNEAGASPQESEGATGG